MQSKLKFQNSSWAKFNQSDFRIWVTWPELTSQRRLFCAFAVFCAQRARRKIFVPWLGNFGHVTWAKKKKSGCFNFKIISLFSFPLILFSFRYSSSLFSLILHLPFLSFHCIHLPFVVLIPFSLHLLCPLWWSSVCLFSLSFYQHLPFVLLITSSALAFVVTCVFAYWHLPFFSFSTGHALFLQSCEPRTSDRLPLVSAGKFLR